MELSALTTWGVACSFDYRMVMDYDGGDVKELEQVEHIGELKRVLDIWEAKK